MAGAPCGDQRAEPLRKAAAEAGRGESSGGVRRALRGDGKARAPLRKQNALHGVPTDAEQQTAAAECASRRLELACIVSIARIRLGGGG